MLLDHLAARGRVVWAWVVAAMLATLGLGLQVALAAETVGSDPQMVEAIHHRLLGLAGSRDLLARRPLRLLPEPTLLHLRSRRWRRVRSRLSTSQGLGSKR